MTSHPNFGRDPSQFSPSAFTAGAAVGTAVLAGAVAGCFEKALQRRQTVDDAEYHRRAAKLEGLLRDYHVERADKAEARAAAAEKCSRGLAVENSRLQREIKVARALAHMCR